MNTKNEVCRMPMILNVKKLVEKMTTSEIVNSSSIMDFDKNELYILSKGELKYNTYLTLDKGIDVGTEVAHGALSPLSHRFLYKVPFSACKVPFLV